MRSTLAALLLLSACSQGPEDALRASVAPQPEVIALPDGFRPEVVDLENGRWSADDCVEYDASSRELAGIVSRIFWREDMPQPFGVFYREERPTYDQMLHAQIAEVTERRGAGDLQALLHAGQTWEIDGS